MISKETVLEAVLEWAKADRDADAKAAELHAIERRAPTGKSDRVRLQHATERQRASEGVRRACELADAAEDTMRRVARVYIDQESKP